MVFTRCRVSTTCIVYVSILLANQVAARCGYADPKKGVRRHVDSSFARTFANLIGEDKAANLNEANSRFINLKGVHMLVARSRTPQSTNFAKQLGIDVHAYKFEFAEGTTIGSLMQAFAGQAMTTQFMVGSFRVDLYFTEHKIAVECDEYGHSDRDPQAEADRQDFVTKQLNCQWVRFNPDCKNFSMMKVINQIMCKILH